MNWKKRNWIEVTTIIGCNVNCDYCPQGLLLKSYPEEEPKVFDMEDFKVCIDKIPSDVDVHFSGFSEPFQNGDCTDMIKYAAEDHNVAVFTTLKGCNVEKIKKLEDLNFIVFEIHLPSQPKLENITVDDQYLETLTFLINSRIPQTMHFRGEKLHENISRANIDADKKRIISRVGNLEVGNGSKAVNYLSNKHIYCSRLKQNILLPNGDVALCCMDYGLRHVLGNLKQNSFSELYETEEFQRLQESMNNPEIQTLCTTCENWHTRFSSLFYKYYYTLKGYAAHPRLLKKKS